MMGGAVGSPDRGRQHGQAIAPGHLETDACGTMVLTLERDVWNILQMSPDRAERSGSEPRVPDYELPDEVVADQPVQLKALADETRLAILDLVLERAATVTELARALGKPKSTVAHHVDVLRRAGLLRVVSTRRVRATTESFYGRTGRAINVTSPGPGHHPMGTMLATALGEQILHGPESGGGFTIRHARIPVEQADAFAERLVQLAREFTQQTRGGEVVYGFIAGVYPTAHAVLPPRYDS
jgi:DNA-binding transcriptional ArsR family regulator